MATTTISGSTVVFSNSTAAANLTNSSLTEDSNLNDISFDVLAASGGGAKTTLWSVDDGKAGNNNDPVQTNNGLSNYDTDLLYKDTAGTIETTAKGGSFWIGADNKIHYSAQNIAGDISHLGVGETFTDTFEYTIRMSNGTLSVGHLTVNIAGENDVAVIAAGGNTGGVTEDTTGVTSGCR